MATRPPVSARPSRTSPRRPRLLQPVQQQRKRGPGSPNSALSKFERLLNLAAADRMREKPDLELLGGNFLMVLNKEM